MIKHNLSIAALCLSGLLGLTITTSGLANNTVNSLSQIKPKPKFIQNSTSTLLPSDLINGLAVYNSTAVDPLVTLEPNQTEYIINNNGIQLGSILGGQPVNGRMYLYGNGVENNLNVLSTTDKANIEIIGSGNPEDLSSVVNCTYQSYNCSVLQVGTGAELEQSATLPFGNIYIAPSSADQTYPSFGKFLLEGVANVSNIYVGGSSLGTHPTYSPDHNPADALYYFGVLQVKGANQSSPAYLHVADSVYVPNNSISYPFFPIVNIETNSFFGHGNFSAGPYASVNISKNLEVGTHTYSSLRTKNLFKNILNFTGPNATISVSGEVISGNSGGCSDCSAEGVIFNVMNGAILNANGGLILQGGNNTNSTNFTVGDSGVIQNIVSQVNVKKIFTIKDDAIFNIGSPEGMKIKPVAHVNIDAGTQINISNNAVLNIYQGGTLSVLGNQNVNLANTSTLRVGVVTDAGSSVAEINGALNIKDNNIKTPMIFVGPNGYLNVGELLVPKPFGPPSSPKPGTLLNAKRTVEGSDIPLVVLQAAHGISGELQINNPSGSDLYSGEIVCASSGGSGYVKPVIANGEGNTIYMCSTNDSNSGEKALTTQQLDGAFGTSYTKR